MFSVVSEKNRDKKQRQTPCSVQFHLHDFMYSRPNYCVLQWNRTPSVRLATALEGIWEIFQMIELMCMPLIIVNIFFLLKRKKTVKLENLIKCKYTQ